MTAEQIRRIHVAIAECDKFIAKESRRAADLRPADATALLDWTIAHKAKLEGMLA